MISNAVVVCSLTRNAFTLQGWREREREERNREREREKQRKERENSKYMYTCTGSFLTLH